jgi:hypothetical protein
VSCGGHIPCHNDTSSGRLPRHTGGSRGSPHGSGGRLRRRGPALTDWFLAREWERRWSLPLGPWPSPGVRGFRHRTGGQVRFRSDRGRVRGMRHLETTLTKADQAGRKPSAPLPSPGTGPSRRGTSPRGLGIGLAMDPGLPEEAQELVLG